METVRNPLTGFALTICATLVLSFLLGVPALFLPQPDRVLVFFYLPFALFGLGLFAGRTTFLGVLGFVGAALGGFVGSFAFQLLFVPEGWPIWPADLGILLALGFGAICGFGGLLMGKVGLRRIDRLTERAPKVRRCLKCGATVGVVARKCWSCRSYLPPT